MIRLHTNHGTITVELFADKAPATVANFLEYVKAGHYDNTVFHRVIDGFMVQGGGFQPGMKQKPTREPVRNEADNGLKNTAGTLALTAGTAGVTLLAMLLAVPFGLGAAIFVSDRAGANSMFLRTRGGSASMTARAEMAGSPRAVTRTTPSRCSTRRGSMPPA